MDDDAAFKVEPELAPPIRVSRDPQGHCRDRERHDFDAIPEWKAVSPRIETIRRAGEEAWTIWID